MTIRIIGGLAFWLFLLGGNALQAWDGFNVTPEHVQLARPLERAQLLVTAEPENSNGTEYADDLTATAIYASSAPQVVSIDRQGQLVAHQPGEAVVTVTVAPGEV